MPKNHLTRPRQGEHLPVLAKEVLDCLQPQAGESYLDLTAGYGGHAEQVLRATGSPGKSLLVDRDEQAIKVLRDKFENVRIAHQDFLGACQNLAGEGREFDLILADLGVSSPHFDKPERGFAFSLEGPLDMRMDQRQSLTAEKLVNEAPEEYLADIIRRYGEEPRSRTIAAYIAGSRPIKTTSELAEITAKAVGPTGRRGKIHPATRTFQALRIAVNDELTQLEMALPLMEKLLAPGGRLAIISFHSLEDRLVKRYFADYAGDRYDASLRLLTKKPIMPSAQENDINPRARSAKLRAVVKIKKER